MFIKLNRFKTLLNKLVFDPLSLFANGEQGVWYDPSDFTTMFQDSAGTTPVTAVEQPVGLLLDKSKGLALGSELVTNGDFSAGSTGWTLQGTATISGGVGIINSSSSSDRIIAASNVLPAGKFVQFSFDVTVISGALTFQDTLGGNNLVFSTSGRKTAVLFSATATAIQFFRNGTAGSFNGTIDNVSIKELAGNHATQSTTTKRPVLSARYNLLTRTEEFDNAAWSKFNATITANATTAPDGTLTADSMIVVATAYPSVSRTESVISGISYTVSVYAKSGTNTTLSIEFRGSGSLPNATFNLNLGTVASGSGTITSVGNGWYRCSIAITSVDSSEIIIIGQGAAPSAGNIFIWGASLVPTNQSTLPYQQVVTSTDYDATASNFPPYLKFDGVDDFMETASINFSTTDKVGVWAGVRKNSINIGAVCELTVSTFTNNGAFVLFAPRGVTFGDYLFQSKGTVSSSALTGDSFPQPITNTLAAFGNISGDSASLNVNGVNVVTSTTDQGSGNFSNAPIYIGMRGGTLQPFLGSLFSLVIRGALSTATQITDTETYTNSKTKAY